MSRPEIQGRFITVNANNMVVILFSFCEFGILTDFPADSVRGDMWRMDIFSTRESSPIIHSVVSVYTSPTGYG